MFYHGTNIGDIMELKPSLSNQGEWIYLSDERIRVLPYCVNPVQVFLDKKYGKGKVKAADRMAHYGIEDDKLILRDIYPKFLQETYGSQTGYLYTFEKLDNLYEIKPHIFGYPKKLKVQNVEVIPDMYQELLHLEKEGKVVLQRYDDLSEEVKQKMNERYLKLYQNQTIEHFKEYWYDKIPYIREHLNDKKAD